MGFFKFLSSTLSATNKGLDILNHGLETTTNSLIEFNAKNKLRNIEGALQGSEFHLNVIMTNKRYEIWSHTDEELLMSEFRKLANKALSGDQNSIDSIRAKLNLPFWQPYISQFDSEREHSLPLHMATLKFKSKKTISVDFDLPDGF